MPPDDPNRPAESVWLVVVLESAILFGGCLALFAHWFRDPSGLFCVGLATLTVILNLRIWVGGALLLCTQFELFLRERPLTVQPDVPIVDILWVMGILLLVYVSSRLHRLAKELRRRPASRLVIRCTSMPDFLQSLQTILHDGISQLNQFQHWPTPVAEFSQAGRRVILPVIVAAGILLLTPPEDQAVESLRLTPAGFRALKIGLAMALLSLGVSATFRIWEWRRISPAQAGVYLRSVAFGALNLDLRSIIRRQIKQSWRVRSRNGNPPGSR